MDDPMDRVHHNCAMPCTLFLNPAVNITVESTVVSAENSHNAAVMLGQDMDESLRDCLTQSCRALCKNKGMIPQKS